MRFRTAKLTIYVTAKRRALPSSPPGVGPASRGDDGATHGHGALFVSGPHATANPSLANGALSTAASASDHPALAFALDLKGRVLPLSLTAARAHSIPFSLFSAPGNSKQAEGEGVVRERWRASHHGKKHAALPYSHTGRRLVRRGVSERATPFSLLPAGVWYVHGACVARALRDSSPWLLLPFVGAHRMCAPVARTPSCAELLLLRKACPRPISSAV